MSELKTGLVVECAWGTEWGREWRGSTLMNGETVATTPKTRTASMNAFDYLLHGEWAQMDS